jgi:hypothetical protein
MKLDGGDYVASLAILEPEAPVATENEAPVSQA